jgi:hypothetical protein
LLQNKITILSFYLHIYIYIIYKYHTYYINYVHTNDANEQSRRSPSSSTSGGCCHIGGRANGGRLVVIVVDFVVATTFLFISVYVDTRNNGDVFFGSHFLTASMFFGLSRFVYTITTLQIAVSYQSLELLQEHGIAATDIAKLQAAGYHTVESVRYNKSFLLFTNITEILINIYYNKWSIHYIR